MIELTHVECTVIAKWHHDQANRALDVQDFATARTHTERAAQLTHEAIEAEKREGKEG